MSLTFYHRNIAQATGIHATTDPANEKLQSLASGGSVLTLSDTLSGGASSISFCFTTGIGDPGVADWPTGVYECYLDVSANGADISFGVRNAGTATGHFARVNSGLTSDLATVQDTVLFVGTGVKQAVSGSWAPGAGSTSDRFEILVASTRPSSHGTQTISIDVDSPTANTVNGGVSIGPWSVATVVTIDGTSSITANRSATAQMDKPIAASSSTSVGLTATASVVKSISGTRGITATLTADGSVGAPPIEIIASPLTVVANRTAAIQTVKSISGSLAITFTGIADAGQLGQQNIDGSLTVTTGLSAAVSVDKPISGSIQITVVSTAVGERIKVISGALTISTVSAINSQLTKLIAGGLTTTVGTAGIGQAIKVVLGTLGINANIAATADSINIALPPDYIILQHDNTLTITKDAETYLVVMFSGVIDGSQPSNIITVTRESEQV